MPEEDDTYIYNQDTYSKHKLDREEARLSKGIFYIQLKIRAENLSSEICSWFKLENPGKGREFVLTPILNINIQN